MQLYCRPLDVPCTFHFSARPGNPQPDRSLTAVAPYNTNNDSFLTFINTDTEPRTTTIIKISWTLNEFRYTIGNSIQPIEVNYNSGINTTQFNHIGLHFFWEKT